MASDCFPHQVAGCHRQRVIRHNQWPAIAAQPAGRCRCTAATRRGRLGCPAACWPHTAKSWPEERLLQLEPARSTAGALDGLGPQRMPRTGSLVVAVDQADLRCLDWIL